MRAFALLALLSGCHALWGIEDTQPFDAAVFDAPVDAACGIDPGGAGDDFDTDGIVDMCDLCPQDPAPTGDMDGDGIGDACDPRPTIKDTRIAFHAFRNGADISTWTTIGGSWLIESTGLVQADSSVTARIDVPGGPYTSIWVETSVTVLSVGAQPYAGACGNLTGSDYHCCDADKSAQAQIVARTADTLTDTGRDYPGAILPGHDLLLQNRSGTGLFTCTLSENNNSASVMLDHPIAAGTVVLHTRGMAVAYRYLFIVKLSFVMATRRDGKALLDAIYAAPHDLEARMIYADYLQDRGDPRGELITLQLQPERTAAQRKREQVLVDEHGEKWIGRLAEITTWIELELGFLARCGVASVPTWAFDRREWTTVKHVGISDNWAYDFSKLIVRPQLVSLESLRVPSRLLPSLCAEVGPARIKTLIVDGSVSPELRKTIAAAPVFAKLVGPIDVR